MGVAIEIADWFRHWSEPQGAIRPLLRGGLWGLNPKLVFRLLDSGILRDTKYLDDRFKYDRYGRFRLSGETIAPPIYHCDTIMADAMDRLGIAPTHRNEIYLMFREDLPDLDKAVMTYNGKS